MSDPRLSFVGSVAVADEAEILAKLAGLCIRISVAEPTLKTFAGQVLTKRLAELLVRLFDRIEIVGDNAVTVQQGVPWLPGPFLPTLRQALTSIRPIEVQPFAGRVIEVGIGEFVGMASDLFLGSTGWSAFVSHDKPQSVADVSNPLGALGAGTLGAAEVFKLVFRGQLRGSYAQDEFSLSLLNYRAAGVQDSEPDLPEQIPMNLTQFGCGSVGTGFLDGVVMLPQAQGDIHLVDNGRFDERNPYKYSLLDWQSAQQRSPKVTWARERLNALVGKRIQIHAHVATAEQYLADLPFDYEISLALAAVDTFQARMEVQETLPRRIINAGIDGTSVEVSVHGFGNEACLACLALNQELETWDAGPIAQKLGLEPQRVHDLIRHNEELTARDLQDIRKAEKVKAELLIDLDSFLGQPLLSFWNRVGYAETPIQVGSKQINVSTAFASSFAGLLLLTEAVKSSTPELIHFQVANSYRQELLGVPAGDTMKYPRDVTGMCLCHSSFRQAIYREKYV